MPNAVIGDGMGKGFLATASGAAQAGIQVG